MVSQQLQVGEHHEHAAPGGRRCAGVGAELGEQVVDHYVAPCVLPTGQLRPPEAKSPTGTQRDYDGPRLHASASRAAAILIGHCAGRKIVRAQAPRASMRVIHRRQLVGGQYAHHVPRASEAVMREGFSRSLRAAASRRLAGSVTSGAVGADPVPVPRSAVPRELNPRRRRATG